MDTPKEVKRRDRTTFTVAPKVARVVKQIHGLLAKDGIRITTAKLIEEAIDAYHQNVIINRGNDNEKQDY